MQGCKFDTYYFKTKQSKASEQQQNTGGKELEEWKTQLPTVICASL